MPPVTRRGYKNEFKHEVKSDPHSLQGRRPRCHRPVRVNASNFQVCSLLPQVSAPRPQSPPAVASIVRSGSTVFHLSSSAPPRLCASQGPFRSAPSSLRFPPRSRRASSPWPRSSDRGAPYFIYPAQRHRASARAKALSGLLSPPSGFRPGAAELAHRGLDRQIGEHRISSIQLSATAPLREPRHFMAL